jgi:L-threonylcarbamoyladenylate synthase
MPAQIRPITPESLDEACRLLANGGLVAIPTETVYGLAADAGNARAVIRLYEAKGRPRFNPLIAHVSGLDMAARQGVFQPLARRLAEAFWPGPLTLILPAAYGCSVCDIARAGLATIALRQPAHPGTAALIAEFGRPLVAPSANRSGHVSPTEAAHVQADLAERIDLILDGGRCPLGIESTILAVDETGVRLMRPGALTREAIAEVIGSDPASAWEGDLSAPGRLKSHYAPRARLRLNVDTPLPGEAWLGFGPHAPGTLSLSETGDLGEAAMNLFSMLRRLDETHAAIAVAPIPRSGLGEALNDRLQRAAWRGD